MNFPGQSHGQWTWRGTPAQLSDERAAWLAELSRRHGRRSPDDSPGDCYTGVTRGTRKMISAEEVQSRIQEALPGARVRVGTFSGDDHFEAVIEAPQFNGKTRVEQHRMVYAALDGLIGGAMHALALKTSPLESD